MKRYKRLTTQLPSGIRGDAINIDNIMAEHLFGEWILFKDYEAEIEKINDMYERQIREMKTDIKCNCNYFIDLKHSSVMLPEFWLCPAHGYKRL